MAYYAASALDGGHGPGPWRAYAGVNPKNIDRAVDLIRRELPSSPRARSPRTSWPRTTFFLGRACLSETNEGVAGSIGSLELYDLGLDYLQRYPSLIQAITRDEILEVAREFQARSGMCWPWRGRNSRVVRGVPETAGRGDPGQRAPRVA